MDPRFGLLTAEGSSPVDDAEVGQTGDGAKIVCPVSLSRTGGFPYFLFVKDFPHLSCQGWRREWFGQKFSTGIQHSIAADSVVSVS